VRQATRHWLSLEAIPRALSPLLAAERSGPFRALIRLPSQS
jgi:hypothetical protein